MFCEKMEQIQQTIYNYKSNTVKSWEQQKRISFPYTLLQASLKSSHYLFGTLIANPSLTRVNDFVGKGENRFAAALSWSEFHGRWIVRVVIPKPIHYFLCKSSSFCFVSTFVLPSLPRPTPHGPIQIVQTYISSLGCASLSFAFISPASRPAKWAGGISSLRAGRRGVRIPVGARDFSLLEILRTGSGAHLASYSVGTRVISRGKAAGAWCSPLTSI